MKSISDLSDVKIQRISDIKEWYEHAEEEADRRSKFFRVVEIPRDRINKLNKIIEEINNYQLI